MANPLPDEAALYEQIEKEKITVHNLVWKILYGYIGDNLSLINLIITYYVEIDKPIPLKDARKILDCTQQMKNIFSKVIHPETIEEGDNLIDFKEENMFLHSVIKKFFNNYMGNDLCAINFCVGYFLDPLVEKPIPISDAKKILAYVKCMCDLMERLRVCTASQQGY